MLAAVARIVFPLLLEFGATTADTRLFVTPDGWVARFTGDTTKSSTIGGRARDLTQPLRCFALSARSAGSTGRAAFDLRARRENSAPDRALCVRAGSVGCRCSLGRDDHLHERVAGSGMRQRCQRHARR